MMRIYRNLEKELKEEQMLASKAAIYRRLASMVAVWAARGGGGRGMGA